MRLFSTDRASVNYGLMPQEMCACFKTEEFSPNYFLCHINVISEQSHILIGLSKYIYYIRKLKESVLPITPSGEAVPFPLHTKQAVSLGGCGALLFLHLELTYISATLSTLLSLS